MIKGKIRNWQHSTWKGLRAILLIFLFLALGEGMQQVFHFSLPGNIIGMILIFFSLKLKLIKLEWVKPASDVLLKYLMLFFVPFGVGIMEYFGFLSAHWLLLLVIASISTLVALVATAAVQHKMDHDGHVG